MLRPSGLRPSKYRPSNQRAWPSGVASVLSASLEIASGGSLPFNDTGTLTLECDDDVSGIDNSGVDLSAKLSLIAANRKWDFTNCNVAGSGTTLTISGLTVQDSGAGHVGKLIVGDGSTAEGTPVGYRDSDDRATYTGGDSNLPVADFAGLAVALAGANVLAALVLNDNYEGNAGVWMLRMIFVRAVGNFSRDDQSDISLFVTGLRNAAGNGTLAPHDVYIGTGFGSKPTEVVFTCYNNILTEVGGGIDRAEYDNGGGTILDGDDTPIASFTFPVHIIGGALCVPDGDAIANALSATTVSAAFTKNVGGADNDGVTLGLADHDYDVDDADVAGDTVTFSVSQGAFHNEVPEKLIYDGTFPALFFDDALPARPLPPFEIDVTTPVVIAGAGLSLDSSGLTGA